MKRVLLLVLAIVVAVVLAACAQILGIKPPERTAFPHMVHLDKGVNCQDCHVGVATSTDKDPIHIPDTAACVACHKKPHDTRECKMCHGLDYVRQGAELAKDSLSFKHATHVPRGKGECVHCHQGVARDSDHIRPTMAVCLSCHEHQTEFAVQSCDRCHKDLPGEHVTPASHIVHDGDWLHEHGRRAGMSRELCSTCHADKYCASCHGKTVPLLPEKMAFDDPLKAGVHRAGFKSRHSLEAKAQPGLCLTCHEKTKTCDACHQDNHVNVASGGRSPHPVGWVGLRGEGNDHGRAAWRDPSVCASCHSGAGEQMCIGCHRVGAIGGNPHRPGWTSKLRRTVDVPCRLCHGGAP